MQDDIFPSSKEDHEHGLHRETQHGSSQINETWLQGVAVRGHLEGSDNLFENTGLPYTFLVGSLATLLSFELFADYGATKDSSYMVASREDFPDSTSYLNCYSDVLWNQLDEEYDRFICN